MPSFPNATLVRLPDRPGQSEISLSVHELDKGPAVVF